MARRRDDSLQNLLRARREPKGLVSVEELRRREAERQREAERDAARAEATRIAAAWREEGTAPASSEASVLRELFALAPAAYFATARWKRVAKAQRELEPRCGVARCGSTSRLRAQHVTHRTLGAEQPGRDVVTLCARCARRAAARGRARGRPLTRDELRLLDPDAPLFDRAAIAALRERYGRPPEPRA